MGFRIIGREFGFKSDLNHCFSHKRGLCDIHLMIVILRGLDIGVHDSWDSIDPLG